jgi:hypothetical protein
LLKARAVPILDFIMSWRLVLSDIEERRVMCEYINHLGHGGFTNVRRTAARVNASTSP